MSDKWQREMAVVTGSGFSSATVSDGFFARVLSFFKRPNADGSTKTFTTAYATDTFSSTSHGFGTGDSVKVSTTGTLPTISGGSLLPSTEYYLYKVDNNSFKLATTWYNCKNAIYIDLTNDGTGTHSVTMMGGGAGWYVKGAFTPAESKAVTYAFGDVTTATDTIYIANHAFYNGQGVFATTTQGGLTASTIYYVGVVDSNNIKLYSQWYRANGNGATGTVDLTAQLGNTLTPQDYQIFLCDTASPAANDYNTSPSGGAPRWVRFGYNISASAPSGYCGFTWYDSTKRKAIGFYGGGGLTYSAGEFTYYLGGGDTGAIIATKPVTTWSWVHFDNITGITGLLEGPEVAGTLKTAYNGGTAVTIEMTTGHASRFTVGNKYFMYDFRSGNLVDFVSVSARDTGADTLTITGSAGKNFIAGAVLCAYAHRYCMVTQSSSGSRPSTSAYDPTSHYIPYVEDTTYESMDEVGSDTTYAKDSVDDLGNIVAVGLNMNSQYYCHKFLLYNITRGSSTDAPDNRRVRGTTVNYLYSYGTATAFQNYRTLNGIDYIALINTSSSMRLYRHSISYS